MSFQPFEVSAPIDDFINSRLKKKNRQKSRREKLHQISCFGRRVQSWHDEHILAGTIKFCRCFRGKNIALRCPGRRSASSCQRKKGTRPPRPTVTSTVNSILVALRDCIGKGDVA